MNKSVSQHWLINYEITGHDFIHTHTRTQPFVVKDANANNFSFFSIMADSVPLSTPDATYSIILSQSEFNPLLII